MKYQNKTILYVDDDIQNLTVFEYAFIKNYTIHVVETVKEAWEILENTEIGVLISDQRMPEQHGIDFLKEVSLVYPNIVRILLTAYADINLVFEAINTGRVYAYITKPWDKGDLQIKLDNALEAYNLKMQNKDLINSLSKTNDELNLTNSKLKEEIQENLILHSAIEQTTEVIILTDINGKIIYVNSAFVKKMSYQKTEVIGQGLEIIGGNNKSDSFYKNLWTDLKKGISWSGVVDYKPKTGEFYKQEMTISPIRNQENKIVSYVSVGRDITKEAKLQELLNQKQKMEAIGTLAGGIAHDFNNILVPIQGYALLLEDDIEPGTQSWDDLQQIIKATKRASDLINQILTFSKKRKVVLKKTHSLEVIKNSLIFIRPSIPKNIKITQDVNIENDYIYADPVQIQQIVINLCNNAFQAMKKNGGEIIINISNITIKDNELCPNLILGSQYLKIKMIDQGVGMDKMTKSKIFEPFFTTKEKGKGTGLGLSNVHGIVHLLKGDIFVESEINKGASFTILLPTLTDLDDTKKETLKIEKGNNQRIVVIDDDESVLTYTSNLLRELNYKVYSFKNSLEALAFISKHPIAISLIFTDFNMPLMNGKELIEALKKAKINIPTIIITGFKEQIKDFDLNNTVIEKPFRLSNISEAIQKVKLINSNK